MSTLTSYTRLTGQLVISPDGEFGRFGEDNSFQTDADLANTFGNYALGYLKAYLNSPDDPRFRIALIYQSSQPKQWGTETFLFSDAVVRTLYPVSGSGQNSLTTFQQKKRENSVHYGTELLLEYTLKDSPGIPIFIPVLFDRGTALGQYAKWFQNAAAPDQLETPVLEVLNLVGPQAAARQNLDAFSGLKEKLKGTLLKKHMRQSLESKLAGEMRSASNAPATPASKSGQTPVSIDPITSTVSTIPAFNPNKNSPQWYGVALDHPTARKLEGYLVNPRQYVEPEQLRQFIRLRELSIDQLKELADNCPLYAAPQGTLLLGEGTSDAWNLFLVRGEVKLVAADGEDKVIGADTANSQSAIATLRPRKFTVTAASSVRFLLIHDAIIVDIQRRRPGSTLSLV